MAQNLTPARLVAHLMDRQHWARAADAWAIALAVSLPWSTSAAGICGALWFLTLLPTLDKTSVQRMFRTAAGGLPVLLWALGVVGLLWSEAPLPERFDGVDSFYKLLAIPLLMIHAERSEFARRAVIGFLASSAILMVCSWIMLLFIPEPWWASKGPGVPIKDPIAQGAIFTICLFVLARVAHDRWRQRHYRGALGCTALAFAFLLNILMTSPSRTALLAVPVLLLLFALKQFSWKGVAALLGTAVVLVAVVWTQSTYLQVRVLTLFDEIRQYRPEGVPTSAGERLEFWRKSISFVAAAPVIGHGTGSIREQFRRAAVGETGMVALVAANPHNQTLAVAIQLGLVGVAVLFAMWLAHLLLFRGPDLAAWVGLVVLTQNIVGSLFNSHLFDFTHGWLYVVGVGIAGGVVMKNAAVRAQHGATGAPGS